MAATTMGEAAELQAAQRLISEQQQIASALRDLIAAVASGADAAAILTGVLPVHRRFRLFRRCRRQQRSPCE